MPRAVERVRRWWSGLSPAWRQALLVFLVVRLAATVVGAIGLASVPGMPVVEPPAYRRPGYGPYGELLLGLWERADALWFVHIARDGWSPSAGMYAACFPAYPLLIRLVHAMTPLGWLASALVASNVAFLVALYLLHRLVARDHGGEAAARALWYLALFPGSLFLLAPFTESLFLALALAATWLARQRHFWAAGLAGFALGATRNVGILIGATLFLELVSDVRERGRARLWQLPWIFAPAVGLGAVLLFWHARAGDALAPLQAWQSWGRSFAPPWQTVHTALRQAWTYAPRYPGGVYLLEALALVGALVVATLGLRRLRFSQAVLPWLLVLPALLNPYPGRVLVSLLRYLAVAFPLFVTLAIVTERDRPLDATLRTVFATLWGLGVTLYVSSHYMY